MRKPHAPSTLMTGCRMQAAVCMSSSWQSFCFQAALCILQLWLHICLRSASWLRFLLCALVVAGVGAASQQAARHRLRTQHGLLVSLALALAVAMLLVLECGI
jgi:hypothetical protein